MLYVYKYCKLAVVHYKYKLLARQHSNPQSNHSNPQSNPECLPIKIWPNLPVYHLLPPPPPPQRANYRWLLKFVLKAKAFNKLIIHFFILLLLFFSGSLFDKM